MIYFLETKEAAQVYNVSEGALRLAVTRNSNKYEWLKVDNANGGRGGKKLFFKISKEQILTAINQELISKNTLIFDEKMQKVNLSDINNSNAICITKENDLNLTESKIKNDLAVLNLKFENLSDEVKQDARAKVKTLKQIEKYIESGLSIARALKIERINRRLFERMRKAYKENGILGLVDTRGFHRKDKTKLSTWMQEYALREYRTFASGGFNFTELWWQIHKEAAQKESYDFIGFDLGKVKPLFSVKTLQNFIKNYYKDKPLEHCIITQGLDKAKSKFLPAQGNQRELYNMKNLCWQIDSSPADIIVRDDETLEPFRPHILSVVDVFSGMGVATLVSKSNSLSLTRLLWKAIDKFGKPDMIKGDNGKDYLSKDFQSLLDGLNITYDAAIAYAGEQKALVERRFGTLQHAGISKMHGYIGNNLAKREMIEQKTPKKERKAKDEYGFTKKTNQKLLLTFSEACEFLEAEVIKWNMSKVRRKKGVKTPLELWNSCDRAIVKISYEEFLFNAGNKEIRVVNKKGILFQDRVYKSANLPSVGTKVKCVQNIDNVKELFIYDLSGNFLCLALDESIAKLSKESFKMLKKGYESEVKAIKEVLKKDEITAFTKLNIKADLNDLKNVFENSLAEVKEVHQKSLAKESLKTQRELEKIKNNANADELILNAKKEIKNDEEFDMDAFVDKKYFAG
ncbi:DDE-type integrase/transposase/recombinase [Campylobacter jejuni]|nr:DDE-type integrase/transposase/recombinase [Campylobacter jejuni]EAJ8180568.1 integrase [Campylobacter jejuni]EAJ8362698.1 integrase [Campylobacter jejuni]ECL6337499.1 DDE-type integrase/transposase/recombinase [Campylobacter jejuni]ECL6564550.1 DDE-type integrase/transposase/recombinase [Campylobacter jejuni]ECL6567939.1 DDE-type integrase/transposase/recombinase [Campylobacter jejuni]